MSGRRKLANGYVIVVRMPTILNAIGEVGTKLGTVP